jgi:hypothetical protein
MRALVCCSVAFEAITVFDGQFLSHILVDRFSAEESPPALRITSASTSSSPVPTVSYWNFQVISTG